MPVTTSGWSRAARLPLCWSEKTKVVEPAGLWGGLRMTSASQHRFSGAGDYRSRAARNASSMRAIVQGGAVDHDGSQVEIVSAMARSSTGSLRGEEQISACS